jgi:eight-cysteine-cluster-containing protein
MKTISVLFFSLFLVGCTNSVPADNISNTPNVPPVPPPPIIDNQPEAFCGSSTEGFCHQDADCQTFGCSGQICGSRFEEELTSTCVWRECYDETDYSLVCGCLNQKCQWYK